MTKLKIDNDLIRELATILDETGLSEIEVTDNGQGLRISKTTAVTQIAAPNAVPPSAVTNQTTVTEAIPKSASANTITSPMVGTIYLSPQPGDPPFVQPGDRIKAGDTLLIIEAMKVMNPIEAPTAGTVKEIMVDDAQPIEFGDPLVVVS